MRRILLSLLLPLLLISTGNGQTPELPSGDKAGVATLIAHPASLPNEAAEELYAMASVLMRRGVRYEKAAEYLAAAVQKEPTNHRYAMALGAAYTGRAASLARAIRSRASDQQNKEKYARLQAEWAEAQQNRSHAKYGAARPVPPPILTTVDDRKPFTQPYEKAVQRIQELTRLALDSWEAGLPHARDPEDRAEAEYLRTWGMILLWRCLTNIGHPIPQDMEKRLTPTALVNAAKKPVELSPENAVYWQSLGDAYYYTGQDASRERNATALSAYDRSLELNTKQPLLAFHAYEIQKYVTPEDAPRFLSYLQQAVHSDPTNFVFHATLFMEQLIQVASEKELSSDDVRNQVSRACKSVPTTTVNRPGLPYQPAVHKTIALMWSSFDSSSLQQPVGQMAAFNLGLSLHNIAPKITTRLLDFGEYDTALLLGSTVLTIGNHWFEMYQATAENAMAFPTISMSNYSVIAACGYQIQQTVAEKRGDRQAVLAIEGARKRFEEDLQARNKVYSQRNEARYKEGYISL